MQYIQECLTGLWPATGASSRRTAKFAVSISVSHGGIDNVRRHGKNRFLRKITHFFSET